MAGPPHHTEGAGSPVCGFPRLSQRKSPFSSKAMSPPCWCDSLTRLGSLKRHEGGPLKQSSGSQPPVTKQTCPSPLQSPAAMDAFPSTAPMTLMAFQKSFGALHSAVPSEPRMARITPRVSTVPPPPFSGANELNTTAGSVSLACKRITTGVDITSTKSGYSRSFRGLLRTGSSGPSAETNGHHQACSGGSKAPCGTKMQAGSAGLHCATAGKHLPLAQKKFAGQVTLSHWLATGTELGMLHVPSAWQKLPPPPQSASCWHFAVAVLQLPPGQLSFPRPSPHPTTATATSSPRIPLAIPRTLRPPVRPADKRWGWAARAATARTQRPRTFSRI